jgi:hypothetical protein
MSERLELILQCLKSARSIAEKNPVLGRVVERIDEAILEAESLLRATLGSDQRKH